MLWQLGDQVRPQQGDARHRLYRNDARNDPADNQTGDRAIRQNPRQLEAGESDRRASRPVCPGMCGEAPYSEEA